MVTNNIGSGYDYASQYDDFWSRSDRTGTDSYLDRNLLVDSIIESVGYGKVLDLGCGEGRLVRALTEKGLDAYGLDISQVAIDRANTYMPGRFFCGSALELPFADQEFDTVVSTDCLEHIHPDDVPRAIAEIRRVCKKHAYLQIATTIDRDGHWHLTVEGRDWWESAFFGNGFIRSPAYYKLNTLDDLSTAHWQITVLMEVNTSWPDTKNSVSPLTSVDSKSHAYLAAYKDISSHIRSGDSVFNWSQTSGAGAYIISRLSNAQSVSIFLADYYEKQVWEVEGILPPNVKRKKHEEFKKECLAATGKINTVIVEGPCVDAQRIKDIYEVLVPGGRLIILDLADSQIWADVESDTSSNYSFEFEGKVSLLGVEYRFCVYITSVEQSGKQFVTSLHGYNSPPENLINFQRDYINPWFPLGAVVGGVRTSNKAVIEKFCNDVLIDSAKSHSADYGASLCVIGYRLLENDSALHNEVREYISKIDTFSIEQSIGNPHFFRWLVSLSYLKSKLLIKVGDIDAALAELELLVKRDVLEFSPTLGTKVINAYLDSGNMYCAQHKYDLAAVSWKNAIHVGLGYLRASDSEWIGNPELPIKGAMYEATQIADLVNICTVSLRALKMHLSGKLPFNRIWEDASDSVFRINKKRLDLLEKQGVRLSAIEDAYNAQAELLEKRWTIMQSMEGMIQERDVAIASQGKMLDERWNIMQSMESMIEERDRIISSLASTDEQVRVRKEDSTQCGDHISSLENIVLPESEIASEERISNILKNKIGVVPFCEISLTHYLFIERLYKTVLNSGSRDLFFFAREGQPLKEMFDIYQSCKKQPSIIRTHYLKVSRRSTLLLSLGALEDESFDVLFRQYRKLSISDFLKSLALEVYSSELCDALGINLEVFSQVFDDLPSELLFQRLLELQCFKDIYEAERVSRSLAFMSYLKGLVGGDLPEVLHVVDVGWKGSIQDNLFNWLNQIRSGSAKVEGYYLGLIAPGGLNERNKKTGLVFSNIGSLTPGFHVFNENRSLFEVILHADHGSAQSYIIGLKGNSVVVEDPFVEQEMIESKVAPVSKDIMGIFVELVRSLASGSLSEDRIFRIALKHHARMVFKPKTSEENWLLSLTHRENFGVFDESRFDSASGSSTLKERLEFSMKLLTRRRSLDLGFWPWLTIRNRAASGVNHAYRLFRLWQSR